MSQSFLDLKLSENLLKALNDLKIVKPTEIQEHAIKHLLSNTSDFVGIAKTGTGKTAAFGLPLLQLIDTNKTAIQAIVLAPTRELGKQICNNLEQFAKYRPEVSIASICGGVPIKPQIERLTKTTHIVVATPGRLIDLINRQAINITEAGYLVLDEADEMISILKESLDQIVEVLPKSRRTILFSATLPGAIKQLIQNYLSKHVKQVTVDMETKG
ncbi:DEAD/DEAH box helicase, partial [Pontimicrobium sp. MEBiC01747]